MLRRSVLRLLVLLFALGLVACGRSLPTPGPWPTLLPPGNNGPANAAATATPNPTPTEPPIPTPSPPPPTTTPSSVPSPAPTYSPLRFAAIGDFGEAGPYQEAVAKLVKQWNPDIIVALGDVNYPNGSKFTIEKNLAVYKEFIDQRRFFPVLGNHDWSYHSLRNLPYLQYFAYLPGNKRYYDIVFGPVHFFMLDTNWQEPDGVDVKSKQAQWLRERLAAATEPWKIVVGHHPPYSSGMHGDIRYMQWPFAEWGADMVLAAHDHTYERIVRDGITYIVNGLGGSPNRYPFEKDTPGSVIRFNQDWGALLCEATATEIHCQFVTISGKVVDNFTLRKGE